MTDANERFCPICSAVYAQSPYRFCPVDGTPLMAVPAAEPLRRAPSPPAANRASPPPAAASQVTPATRKVRGPAEPVRAQPAAPIVFEAPPVAGLDVQDAPTRHERVAERSVPTRSDMIEPAMVSKATSGASVPHAPTPEPLRFPETDWFRRPPSPDDIDPETGRVLVDTSVYRRQVVKGRDSADDA